MALTMTSLSPALANNNNNRALNLMAMQMYAQNQGLAGNSVYGRSYNPLIGNAAYGNYGSNYGNSNYGLASYNPYANSGYNGLGGGCNGGNNMAYGNMIAPQYSRLAQEAAQIQSQLSYGNLPSWQVSRLQNKLVKIQRQESGLAYNGYGSPYGNNGGFLNNIRGSLGI